MELSLLNSFAKTTLTKWGEGGGDGGLFSLLWLLPTFPLPCLLLFPWLNFFPAPVSTSSLLLSSNFLPLHFSSHFLATQLFPSVQHHSHIQLKEVQEELKAVSRRAEEQARDAALDKEALEQGSSAEQAELVARLAAAEQRLEESRAADGRLREEVREKEAQVQALSRDLEEGRAADGRLRDEVQKKEAQLQARSRDLEETRATDGQLRDKAKELEQRLTSKRDRLADSLAATMQQLEDSPAANAQVLCLNMPPCFFSSISMTTHSSPFAHAVEGGGQASTGAGARMPCDVNPLSTFPLRPNASQAEEQVQAAVRERQALEQRLEDLELSTTDQVSLFFHLRRWPHVQPSNDVG
ncbi:unnamed protein product [Closterium sp. Yama58-4]|nr:unnamed protein product [Closterium sp. Yama58-4]